MDENDAIIQLNRREAEALFRLLNRAVELDADATGVHRRLENYFFEQMTIEDFNHMFNDDIEGRSENSR